MSEALSSANRRLKDSASPTRLIGDSPSAQKRWIAPWSRAINSHIAMGARGSSAASCPMTRCPACPMEPPVELIFHGGFLSVRKQTGALHEAVMGRLARAEGQPAIVSPFHAPTEAEIRTRLTQAGLPEDGMETLIDPAAGQPLARRSTIGWVYWGRLVHTAYSKVQAAADSEPAGQTIPEVPFNPQRNGELEFYLLRQLKATNLIQEHFNTRSMERADTGHLSEQLRRTGTIQQAPPPTPRFARLQARLAAAGIAAALQAERLAFKFAPAVGNGETLKLARPVPHPWLPGENTPDAHLPAKFATPVEALERGLLTEIGPLDLPEYKPLAEANSRLSRLLARQAPQSLVRKATENLVEQVNRYVNALLQPDDLRMWNRVAFSGRAVIAPGTDLYFDQISLPDEIVWTLYGPLVACRLGEGEAVDARSEAACRALEAVMAESWLIVHRTPSFTPTTMLAFRPVRNPDRVIRIHPFACDLLNADFDGDQAAVYLPLTEAGQREAGQKLTIAAHLTRDPALIEALCGLNEAIWGLADLSRTKAGRAEIDRNAGREIPAPDGFITRATLTEVMHSHLIDKGSEETLAVLHKLMKLGFQVVQQSGASMSPFIGSSLNRTAQPDDDDPARWESYTEELTEQLTTRTDFDDPDLGPQLLAVHSGSRQQMGPVQLMEALGRLVGVPAWVRNILGERVLIRRGYSQGLTTSELQVEVVEHLENLAQLSTGMEAAAQQLREENRSQSFHVLGRASRARQPGHIFARAAATGEIDPLVDWEARLFVGTEPASNVD